MGASTASCVDSLIYQWYKNTTNSNQGGAPLSGATNSTYTIPTDLSAGAHYYYCIVNTKRTNVATVNVTVPVITITTQPADKSVVQCNISGSLTVAANVTQGAQLNYQWYSNTTKSNSGGTLITDATSASYTIQTTLTKGTYYYYCVVSATCGATSVSSNVATMTVTGAVITITTQPTDKSVAQCNISGNLTVAATVTQGATLSYQWYSNTTKSNTGGTLISGATSSSFTIPTTLTAGTYYYYCVVSANCGATSEPSNVATVTVSAPVITIIRQPATSITVAHGSSSGGFDVLATVTQSATLSYQWYYNATNSNTGGTPVQNATNKSFTVPYTLTAGTHYYYCMVSATGGATSVATNVTKVEVAYIQVIDGYGDELCRGNGTGGYTFWFDYPVIWEFGVPNTCGFYFIYSYNQPGTECYMLFILPYHTEGCAMLYVKKNGVIVGSRYLCSGCSRSPFNEWITVYPNPASSAVYIEIDVENDSQQQKTARTYDVRLYDKQGNLLRQQKTAGGRVEFNISNLLNGIYFVHVYDGVNKQPEMRPLVVEH